ncbi:hypothetical protein RJT34_15923 [Clitoria ternatea]|uniref:Uncharacterized protein n=1 Tax=Clitoria ternatea TaxID=43366 RepID=A0AAN9J6J3_CLITE
MLVNIPSIRPRSCARRDQSILRIEDWPGPNYMSVIPEIPKNIPEEQPREVEQPYDRDVEVIEITICRYRDPPLPLGVEELASREAAIVEDPLGFHYLPEPPHHPLRSLTPVYIPVSPEEDSDEQDEDLEKDTAEDLEANLVDFLATDPTILLAFRE